MGARKRQACTEVAELSVIIILALGAITTAGWTMAKLGRLSSGEAEDHRLRRALQSAAEALGGRQLRLLCWLLALEATAGLGLSLRLNGVFDWWLTLGLAAGIACAFAMSQLSVALSLNTATAASRLASGGDSALVVSLRSASALVLVSGATAAFIGAGALLAVRLGALAPALAFLQGLVLGALSACLVLHLIGSALRVAGVTSRTLTQVAGKHPFYCLDSSNPSLVLDLVAQHTGSAQGHSLRVFWVMCLQQVLVLMLTANNPSYSEALLATVLLTQSASLVCTGAVQLALRTSDGMRAWPSVLTRGLTATGAMTLVALAGASYWLLGAEAKVDQLLCALLGAALTGVTVGASLRSSVRQGRRLESHPDGLRRPGIDLVSAVPSALLGAAAMLATVSAALLVLSYLMQGAERALVGLLWLSLGAFVGLPYVAGQGLLEPLTEATASLAALRLEQGPGEPHAHLGSLCAVGQQAGTSNQIWFTLASALVALLTMGCLSLRPEMPTSLLSLSVQGLAALGIVMGGLGVLTRRIAATALVGLNEVSRHQRADADAGTKPGYANYVEVITSHALQGSAWIGAALVLAVWAAAAVISNPTIGTDGTRPPLTTFLAFSTAAGISVALLGVGIASFVGVTRGFRRVATGSNSPLVSDSLNTAQLGVAEMAGTSLAPAALMLVHLTIAVVLATTPFVH